MVYDKLKVMFLIFLLFFISANPVHAQELQPSNILQSTGAQFIEGWNYFRVQTAACNIGQILNEVQADGGGALTATEIWIKENDAWQQRLYPDTTKINSDNLLAFFSNQKFFFDLDPAVCSKNDDKRQEEIGKLRSPGGKNWLDSLMDNVKNLIFTNNSPNDFWQPVASASATLITRYSLQIPDLTVSGKLRVGLLSFDDLEASIFSLTNLVPLKK